MGVCGGVLRYRWVQCVPRVRVLIVGWGSCDWCCQIALACCCRGCRWFAGGHSRCACERSGRRRLCLINVIGRICRVVVRGKQNSTGGGRVPPFCWSSGCDEYGTRLRSICNGFVRDYFGGCCLCCSCVYIWVGVWWGVVCCIGVFSGSQRTMFRGGFGFLMHATCPLGTCLGTVAHNIV
jgi:hypothetical protein